MDLALTVIDPLGSGTPLDVVVSAEPGAPFATVRENLLAMTGRSGRRNGRFLCAATPVEETGPLGAPPLVQGAVLTLDRAEHPGPEGLLELHVLSGPDAGAVHPLPPGEHGIGRASMARIQVDDPDVSRLHALLRIGLDGPALTTVHDLGSTNGTTVDGTPVAREGRRLEPGQVVQVGSTRLELRVPAVVPVSCRPDGEGHLAVNRPPRHVSPLAATQVTMPAPPPPHEPTRLPLVAIALPLIAGLALVALTRSPTYLAFVLLSPLMMLGTFLNDRWSSRRSGAARARDYADALLRAQARIDDAVASEVADRHHRHPDLATLFRCATGPQPRLWERRAEDPDFLQLRLGLGSAPAAVEVRARDGLGEQVTHPLMTEVPITVSLRGAGTLGVAGPRSRALPLVRALLAQLTGWHSPRDLGVVVLCAEPGREWEWTRWLPHVRPGPNGRSRLLVGLGSEQARARVDELVATLEARLEHGARHLTARWSGRSTVVLLDGAEALRRLPGVARLLAEGPGAGIYVICLDTDLVALPAECRATAEVRGDVGTRLRVVDEGGTTYDDVRLDGVSRSWAHRVARALAPLRDATPDQSDSGLPVSVRLLDLLAARGLDATDPAAVVAAWRARPRTTRAPIGATQGGEPFVVDIARDGPHLLIAGTTGAGKSELLQALVASLAVSNRPDELVFVLIDYKGGAALRDCARLPHTVGLVTDLDGHLTERALASLGAELRRRERLLHHAGCADLGSYLDAAGPGTPALPRLVLLVDEFATLAEELPDFVGGLVGIAQRGRSLGVHLVLATQRPAGVVSADIRANTGLRIALRVTDPAESTDVVDVRDAADISRTTPGRAVVRAGTDCIRAVQTARVSGAATGPTGAAVVHPLPWESVGATSTAPTADVAGDAGPTDLSRLVDATATAAQRLGVATVASPWLPPLPDVIDASHLAELAELAAPGGHPAAGQLGQLGLLDLPTQQCQRPWRLDLRSGVHLLVCGGPRSGRTTLLRTLAAGVAEHADPADVHLYALDGGGGLAALADLPHCGAVVGRDDIDRGARLIERLNRELDARLAILAGGGPDVVLPWSLLLVDGWEALQQAYDEVGHGRALDTLTRLVRDGAAGGFRVVLTGDRSLLASRIGANFGQRLVLRLADAADYALAGIPARRVPAAMPPGRGLLAPEATEVQVAVYGGDPSGAAQVAALRTMARRLGAHVRAGARPPSWAIRRSTEPRRLLRVDPLPGRVDVRDLMTVAKAASSGPGWVLVGVGGDEAGPLGVDLDSDGPAFVVTGPPGSGRSTALAGMAEWLLGNGRPVAVVAHRRSPLRQLAGEPGVLAVLGAGDGTEATRLLAAQPDLVVLADDAETLHDCPVEQPLLDLLRVDSEHRGGLVLAGAAADLATRFRGLTVEARRGRTGLLLGPVGPADGDLLGVRGWSGAPGPPGRGLLVVRGQPTPVQSACPTQWRG